MRFETSPPKLARGTQVVYIPTHAKGLASHRDAERGFVTSIRGNTVFCRYWSKSNPDILRTKANSEGTPQELLVVANTKPQAEVDAALEKYCNLENTDEDND